MQQLSENIKFPPGMTPRKIEHREPERTDVIMSPPGMKPRQEPKRRIEPQQNNAPKPNEKFRSICQSCSYRDKDHCTQVDGCCGHSIEARISGMGCPNGKFPKS